MSYSYPPGPSLVCTFHIFQPTTFNVAMIGLMNRTMGPREFIFYLCIALTHLAETPVFNQIARMLKGSVKSTPSPINGPVQTALVTQRLLVNTDTVPGPNWLMSPTRDVMSPTPTFPNVRCNGTCVITEEENEGRVVSHYAALAHAYPKFPSLGVPISMQG